LWPFEPDSRPNVYPAIKYQATHGSNSLVCWCFGLGNQSRGGVVWGFSPSPDLLRNSAPEKTQPGRESHLYTTNALTIRSRIDVKTNPNLTYMFWQFLVIVMYGGWIKRWGFDGAPEICVTSFVPTNWEQNVRS
jgi:hypothetical protein